MAVTIVRTPWIDDDGTGTTGTVINNAVKTALYNDIDGALAKVAQLAGGNAFTGNQGVTGTLTVNGVLTVSGFGRQTFSAGGTGGNTLIIQNTLGGATNFASLQVGNNVDDGLLTIYSYASTYTPVAVYDKPNASAIVNRAVGVALVASSGGGVLTFHTGGNTERMRIASTGIVSVNTTNTAGAQFGVAASPGYAGIGVQNLDTVNTAFMQFLNNASGIAGSIAQTGATSVVYSTTSDARLKDDAGRAADLSALRAVVVHDFTWKADGIRDRGIFAQEAHALFPRAVSAGTDDRTESGDLARPWMTDYSKFVADLIVGWQQHDAELAALRAQLATLKG